MQELAQSTAESEIPARSEDLRAPSKLKDAALLRVLKAWFREDAQFSAKWRAAATKDFAFAASRQYSDEDAAVLEDSDRPAIVFNYTLPVLKIVAGIEINSRHEVKFLPRGTEDTEVNEVLTAEHQPEPAVQDVEPLIAFVGLRLGCGAAVRDDQLVGLDAARPRLDTLRGQCKGFSVMGKSG